MSNDGKSTLHRNLSIWGAIGLSVALLGPSMAANINPQAPAGHVGRAVPLVFALSTLAVLLVAYGFVRLCQNFAHAGSVYGFAGATLGPRTGFVAGWLLLATYTAFIVCTTSGAALFFTGFLHSTGLWTGANWLVPGTLSLLGVALLASRPAVTATKVLLALEIITMVAILILAVVVLIKIGLGDVPRGQHLTTSIFTLPPDMPTSGLLFAMTFGFLSFAGFEAASTLGEETRNPRRAIPIALLGTVILAGVFFVVVTSAEALGFGTNAQGIADLIASPSLMGDLASTYVGSWLGPAVTLGAAISAFASALACTVGASRLLFAMGRDGFGHPSLGRVRQSDGVPQAAVGTTLIVVALAFVLLRLFATADVTDIFFWAATIGSLALMAAYALCLIGATRFLLSRGRRPAQVLECVIPLLGLLAIGFILYTNIYPVPEAPYSLFPYLVAAWLLVGLLIVVLVPGLAARIGEQFIEDEAVTEQTVIPAPHR